MSEMRERPVRPNIWRPVVKWGVIDTDRKYVVIITLLCFAVPFWREWAVYRIPLPLPAALAGLAASIAFFRFIRQGRRPHWFKNRVRAIIEFCQHWTLSIRRSLPRDEERRGASPWITDGTEADLTTFLHTGEAPY